MSRRGTHLAESPLVRARTRMLDADRALAARPREHDLWTAWQRAATDYWVLLHRELAPYRRGDPSQTPTVEELRVRADLLAASMDGVPPTWRLAPPSRERTEHLARVGWFHEQAAGLYGPIWDAARRVKAGDPSGAETLIRFLEADVYCFRSGYEKADAIRLLRRVPLDEDQAERLRRVVLDVVASYDRQEFRATVRLARLVDSPGLREVLHALVDANGRGSARRARWVLDGLAQLGARSLDPRTASHP